MKKIIGAIALGAVIVTMPASAQAPDALSQQLDLTRQQALERADRLFARFDLNRDGFVTRLEAQQVGTKLLLQRAATGRDVAPGIGGHTLHFLERRFAGVNAVNREEFEGAILAHFDQMDRNHDGVLTPSEREEAHGQQAAR